MTDLAIRAGQATIHGDLESPAGARGLVVFVHGSGSSRHSPRNRAVAAALRERGLATLLFDLLTEDEEAREEAGAMERFDIAFLAGRLDAVLDHVAASDVRDLPLGLFGSSTGAAAALAVAATHPVAAVVSRGGRPDLAMRALRQVPCPVLLIVGARDRVVLEMNEEAARMIPGEASIHVVPEATHLFEEPGALEEVADVAGDWFAHHLAEASTLRPSMAGASSPGSDILNTYADR